MHRIILLVGLATAASLAAQSPDSGVAGVWSLVEVNDKPLPVVAWDYKKDDSECENLTSAGTMLMDSGGRWSALTVGLTTCPAGEGEEPSLSEESTIFSGSYSVSGDMISFHDETLDSIDHGYIASDRLELTVEGIGDFKGQTAEFVFQKKD